MLKAGEILPPVPIQWQGNPVRTTALRGAPVLLFFSCASTCPRCRAFFQSMGRSEEFAYWSIRPLWVDAADGKPAGELTAAGIIDTAGRCRLLLTRGGTEPALAVLDPYQEFRATLEFAGHLFPHLQDLESSVRSALLASPG